MSDHKTLFNDVGGPFGEVAGTLVGTLFRQASVDPQILAHWCGKKGQLRKRLEFILDPDFDVGADSLVVAWQKFYLKHFGLDLDLSEVAIPDNPGDFTRILIIFEYLSLNAVYEACSGRFPCWRYSKDLDKAIIHSDRNPNQDGSYAIRLRNRQEADEELRNLSAEQLAQQGTKGITLLERLIHELKYYDETGEHLDNNNVTLCSGSRDLEGKVPSMDWNDGRVRVDWRFPRVANSDLRSREVLLF